MSMSHVILVPFDGSAMAELALPHARRLAFLADATLVLVRVVHVHAALQDALEVPAPAVRAAEENTQRVAQEMRDAGMRVETDVFVQTPAAGIALAAQVHRANLIVMSTHGRTGVGRTVLGSVAEGVLRAVRVPLFLVPSHLPAVPRRPVAPPAQPYSTVLIPLDGTALAETALAYASQAPWLQQATLVLMHSVQRGHRGRPGPGDALTGPAIEAPDVSGVLDVQGIRRPSATVRAYLARRATAYAPNTARHIVVTRGDPALMIAQVAAAQGVDLVVMATHPGGGIARITSESIAVQVAHAVTVPVLLLPPAAQHDERLPIEGTAEPLESGIPALARPPI